MKLAVNKVCGNCPNRSGIDPALCGTSTEKVRETCIHPRSRKLAARAIQAGLGLSPQNLAFAVNPPTWADGSIKPSTLAHKEVMIPEGDKEYQATFVIVPDDTEPTDGKNLVHFDGTDAQLEALVTHRTPE